MMTRRWFAYALVVPVLCVGHSSLVRAQSGGFEGIVVYKMAGARDGGEMTQMYKGMKSRTEVNSGGQGAAVITDMTTGVMTMLIPPQKMYMTMDLRQMAQGLRGFTGGGGRADRGAAPPTTPGQPPPIKATGRTETVAGYTCEWYVMGEKGESEVCAAKGLGYFAAGQNPMGGRGMPSASQLSALGANEDMIKLFKDGFFPLKVMAVRDGKSQLVMEATKVEKKTLDAALFAPPPDYTEMKMPGFGR